MIRSSSKMLGQLFADFLKISPFTFGGGFAVITLIEREVVGNRKWMSTKDVADLLAVAQSVPGAVAVNFATLIGYRMGGVIGAIIALLGILLPTSSIVIGLAVLFLLWKDNPKIVAALAGIQPAIVAMIAYAAYKLGKTAAVDKTAVLLIIVTVAVLYFGHSYIHPIFVIFGGATAGMAIFRFRSKAGAAPKSHQDEKVHD